MTQSGNLRIYPIPKERTALPSIAQTFNDVQSVLSMEHMTNAQLKRILEKIVVDEHDKVDIYLRLFSDIGLDNSVLVSNNSTERAFSTFAKSPLIKFVLIFLTALIYCGGN